MPKRFLKISKRFKKSPRAYWTKFQTASEMAAITPAVVGASSSEFLTNTARLYRLPSGRRKKPMSLIPMICPCALQSPVPVLCPMTAFPEGIGFTSLSFPVSHSVSVCRMNCRSDGWKSSRGQKNFKQPGSFERGCPVVVGTVQIDMHVIFSSRNGEMAASQ